MKSIKKYCILTIIIENKYLMFKMERDQSILKKKLILSTINISFYQLKMITLKCTYKELELINKFYKNNILNLN